MTNGPAEDIRSVEAAAAVGFSTKNGGPATGQKREQTRNAILEATWTALAHDGYEKITTRRIATFT